MAGPELKAASPLQVAKAVFWSFFGVRRSAEHEKDLAQIKPAQLGVDAGIVGAADLARGAVRAPDGRAGRAARD